MKNLRDLKVLQVEATPGKVVRAFRKNFGITLEELEAVTGISQSNLSAIENDKIDLGVRRAELLAAALGLEPSVILFPRGRQEGPLARELRDIRARAKRILGKKREAFG